MATATASVHATRCSRGVPSTPSARSPPRRASIALRVPVSARAPRAPPVRTGTPAPPPVAAPGRCTFLAWGVGVWLALGFQSPGAAALAAAADDYFMGSAPADVPGAVSPLAGTRVGKLDAAGLYGSLKAGAELERATRASLRATGVVDAGTAPQFIRLLFHDAGTFDVAAGDGGADGSIRFRAELERPENRRLRVPVKALAKWRAEHGGEVGGELSWADLVAVAGAEAVEVCGGPRVEVGV